MGNRCSDTGDYGEKDESSHVLWCVIDNDMVNVTANDHVLQLGLGSGVGLEHVYKYTQNGNGSLSSLEPDANLVDEMKSRFRPQVETGAITILCGSLSTLPFGDASMDKVFTVYDDSSIAINVAEVKRVLKPGGRFALVFDDGGDHAVVAGQWVEVLSKYGFKSIKSSAGPLCVGVCGSKARVKKSSESRTKSKPVLDLSTTVKEQAPDEERLLGVVGAVSSSQE